MKNISRIGYAVILALVLVVMTLFLAQMTQAAPPAIPTPVSAPPGRAASSTPALVTFCNAQAISADGRCKYTWDGRSYGVLDVQYIIDQGTSPNTTTLKLQYSNDGINWATGPTLVSNNAADATDMLQLGNFGRYTNIYVDVTNGLSPTRPVTITVIAVAK